MCTGDASALKDRSMRPPPEGARGREPSLRAPTSKARIIAADFVAAVVAVVAAACAATPAATARES